MTLTPDQQAEIDALRAASRHTLRAVSEGMEAHLYDAIPVLDHGFIRVVDYMGDDTAICPRPDSPGVVHRLHDHLLHRSGAWRTASR